MVRKELIGRSVAQLRAAKEEMRKELRQKPQRRGPLPPSVAAKVRAKMLPPSWVSRIIPVALTKVIKPYAMKMQFSNRYVTAEVFDTVHDNAVVVSASSKEDGLKTGLESLTDRVAAAKVAEALGERLKEKGIPGVAYYRNKGELYHGKRKAFLDKLRETGVKLI